MANITKWDPFSQILNLQKQFFEDWLTPSTRINVPTTDVYLKDDNNLMVEAHLPQFEEKDIDVNVENGYLIIQAQKHEKDEDKSKKYIVRESSSSFYRSIQLPERADQNKIEAKIKNGVLTVNVKLKELPKAKKISIKTN
jgi:HSP20 family protein